jgi:hypothetical protein
MILVWGLGQFTFEVNDSHKIASNRHIIINWEKNPHRDLFCNLISSVSDIVIVKPCDFPESVQVGQSRRFRKWVSLGVLSEKRSCWLLFVPLVSLWANWNEHLFYYSIVGLGGNLEAVAAALGSREWMQVLCLPLPTCMVFCSSLLSRAFLSKGFDVFWSIHHDCIVGNLTCYYHN